MNLPPRIPGLTLLRRIGSGATADVFAARRDIDAWRCAVKVLRVPGEADRARIRREAAVLSSVRLPHLIHLHDVVGLADGRLALVLDLVEGGSLADVLDQRGHLKPAEATAVLGPVFATLEQLHRRGIVHGDVSTSNILLTPEGAPRLSDLGAARLIGEGPGEVCATMGFVAPEVLEGGRPSAAADVHAVGAVGWHLLVGRALPPWPSRPPLGQAAPGTPSDLAALVDECVSAEPARRPSAADAALRLGDRPERLEVPTGSDMPDRLTLRIRGAEGVQPADEPPGRHRTAPARSRVPRVLVGIPLSLLALAAAGLALGRALGPGSDAPTGGGNVSPVAAEASASPTSPALTLSADLGPPSVGSAPVASTHVGRRGSTPGSPRGSRPAGPSTSGPGSPSPSRTVAWSGDPVQALAVLADARAAALVAGDARALGQIHARGSPGLVADLGLLSRLRDGGYRYRDLRYRVLEAVREDTREDRLLVTARIDTRPFVVLDARGRASTRPATTGSRMRFELVRAGENGWRIASMERV